MTKVARNILGYNLVISNLIGIAMIASPTHSSSENPNDQLICSRSFTILYKHLKFCLLRYLIQI